jgi:trk system potassium uptake protein TrkH
VQGRLVKFAGALALYPARTLFAWYLGLVSAGTAALMLPACRTPAAEALGFVDALFTAASAACVTGLMVKSAGADFSFTGQVVLLVLIQLGGLGVMSIATLLFVGFTGRQPMHFRLLTEETLGAPVGTDLRRLLGQVVALTLLTEFAGAVVLALARLGEAPAAELAWWSVFHAVSAFCNSGIALQNDSLAAWSGDAGVLLAVAVLIVAGGLGFPVLIDLFTGGHRWARGRRYSVHTKIVLAASAILLALGAAAFWLLERDGALAGAGPAQSTMTALFQSATARTAGFATLEMGALSNATLFVLIMLMFVGGGPCSTAGGIKVTTLSVLVLQGTAQFRRRWQTAAFGRRMPARVLVTATVVTVVQALILIAGLMAVLVIEAGDIPHEAARQGFLDHLFETVSALGTVGLSTGVTTQLKDPSLVVITAMMVLGRVGPLAIASLLMREPAGPRIRYPEEEIIVG